MPSRHLELSEAEVHPYEAPLIPDFRGGLRLERPHAYRRFRQTRFHKPADTLPVAAATPAQLRGDWIYGGAWSRHFGHFMAELAHRLLPGRSYSQTLPWIFSVTAASPQTRVEQWPSFIHEVLRYFDLPQSQVQLIARPTRVQRLIVPEAGSDLGGGPKAFYLDLLDAHGGARLDREFPAVHRPPRIYVSRSALGGASARLLGERYLEQALEREGFFVLHPERYGLLEQMDFYRRAEVVIFGEGSACHGVELLGRSLRHCIYLNRRDFTAKFFTPILQRRSQRYDAFLGNHYLGSPLRHPAGHVHRQLAATLIDAARLLPFLRGLGLGRFQHWNRDAFIESAEHDLQAYLLGLPDTQHLRFQQNDAETLRNRFAHWSRNDDARGLHSYRRLRGKAVYLGEFLQYCRARLRS
jgi:hypothetical protein